MESARNVPKNSTLIMFKLVPALKKITSLRSLRLCGEYSL
jgi:hypothetical protein